MFDRQAIDGSGVFHGEPKRDPKPGPDFACPHCGGRHFGRSIAKTIDGEIVMPETASCLDERAVGCRWRGAWPTGEGSRKIDWEIAGLRSELRRQLTEAWMRLDYATADRIADLLGERRPSDHEAEDTKCSRT